MLNLTPLVSYLLVDLLRYLHWTGLVLSYNLETSMWNSMGVSRFSTSIGLKIRLPVVSTSSSETANSKVLAGMKSSVRIAESLS